SAMQCLMYGWDVCVVFVDNMTEQELQEVQSASPSLQPSIGATGEAPTPSGSRRAYWTKPEDVRLLLCLLDSTHPVTQGQTLIEYFRYQLPRDQMDLGYRPGERALAEIFND